MSEIILTKRLLWVGANLLLISIIGKIASKCMENIERNNKALVEAFAAADLGENVLYDIHDVTKKVDAFFDIYRAINANIMCMLVDDQLNLWATTHNDHMAVGPNGERPGVNLADAGNRPHATTNPFARLVKNCKTSDSTSEIIHIDRRTFVGHARMLSGKIALICMVSY